MNVLIIGGLGFLGSNLALKLIKYGYKVRILDNFSKCNYQNYEELKSQCDINIGSIYSNNNLDQSLQDIGVVFNLASPQMLDCEKNEIECYNTNILGLEYLLHKMRFYHVKKLIFSSTTSLYYGNGNQFTENDIISANDNYTLSKIIAEQMIVEKSKELGFDYCIFRNAPVYGQRQFLGNNGSGITMKIINSLFTDNLLNLYSYGRSQKEFLYVNDLVHFYCLAIHKGNGVYNMSNGSKISISKVAKILQQITKKNGNIKYSNCGELYNRSFSNRNLIDDFGDFEFTNLQEGLLNTLNWYKEVMDIG